jgi:hypothetical protein
MKQRSELKQFNGLNMVSSRHLKLGYEKQMFNRLFTIFCVSHFYLSDGNNSRIYRKARIQANK